MLFVIHCSTVCAVQYPVLPFLLLHRVLVNTILASSPPSTPHHDWPPKPLSGFEGQTGWGAEIVGLCRQPVSAEACSIPDTRRRLDGVESAM